MLALLLGLPRPGSVAAAETADRQVTVTRALDYGEPGDAANQLDAFVPQDGHVDRPAIVLVHGGGWTGGSRAEVEPDAMAMAQAGFVAFSIDYGVDRAPRWPDELEDVRRAVRWVQDHAATYAIDPANVGLFGSSAGGNLVMLVATQGVGDGHPPVKAASSWSGPSDLTTLAITNQPGDALAAPSTVPIPGADVPIGCVGDESVCIGTLGPQFIQAYMDCPLTQCPEQYRDASPVFWATSSTPPMFLAGAEHDLVPMSQNFEMANALTTARVASQLLLVVGEQHAEGYRTTALAPTLAFFTRYLVQHVDPKVAPDTPPSVVEGSLPLPPFDAHGLLPAPAPPAAASPRTGLSGFVVRHIRPLLLATFIAVDVGALLFLIARRRRSRHLA